MEENRPRLKKCSATGKVRFPNKLEAILVIAFFRWKLYKARNKIDGTRVKHRAGKVAQRRAYYCRNCRGYHLTKWSKSHFNRYNDSRDY